MIISSSQVLNVLKVWGRQVKSGSVRPRQDKSLGAASDQVAISGESRIKQKAILAAKSAPEVREDIVGPLRQAIATGTYTVSDAEVAEKMIYRSLVDNLV